MTSTTRNDGSILLIARPGDEPIAIWRARSRERINGLVWEDTVRSTSLYPDYVMPASVRSPIDIAPHDDLIQGIPTHVKAKRTPAGSRNAKGQWSGSVDMACAYQLFLLGSDPRHTHHRLVVGLYDVEMHEIGDEKVEVHCYHTVLEAIQSPATFAAYYGDIPLDEIRRLREDTHAFTDGFPITQEEVLRARALFHPVTTAWRESGAMGIARISNKIDLNQVRPQAQISLADLRDQLAGEPDYAGRIVQPNWIEHTVDFHGLPLPFRTTAKERVFVKPKDPYARPRRPRMTQAPATTVAVDPDAKYIGAHIGREDYVVGGGTITTVPHGDERTIAVLKGDDAYRLRVSLACRYAGGRWIDRGRLWVLTHDQARFAYGILNGTILPSPRAAAMVPVNGRNDLFDVFSASGIPIRLLRQPNTNWALRPDDGRGTQDPAETSRRSKAIIDRICGRTRTGSWNAKHGNWLVPQDPPELIRRVARAISEFDDRRR